MTAGNNYLRAGNYYYTGERFIAAGRRQDGDVRKALRCYRAALGRSPERRGSRSPVRGTSRSPAYFMRAPGVVGRAPTVVLFDGMDNCKEMSVLFAGLEFAKRGMHTLAIDGRDRASRCGCADPRRYDYEVPGTAAYDYVAERPEVDPEARR